jgi:uncharacterized protein (DUF305 family)
VKTNPAHLLLITLIAGGPVAAEAQAPPTATRDAQRRQLMQQRMTDGDFIQAMSEHERDGIELARAEEERGSSPAVQALARAIHESEQRDLAALQAREAGANTVGTSARAEHDRLIDQQDQTLAQHLASLSGAALDRAFVDEMIRHHQIAIEMSGRTRFSDENLRTQSERMVETRRAQLKQLEQAADALKPDK